MTPRKPRTAAIYARVSTDEQTTQNQIRQLHEVAERAGWEVVGTYTDHGISGAKGRNGRPAFDSMLKDATRRKFDVIMAWSVDRLGRSLQDLIGFLTEIHEQGVHLYLHQQAVDTSTPAGKALFQMMGVFAEFERAMIQERVKAGLQRAVAAGKRLGRPTIPAAKESEILTLRKKGLGVLKIARQVGVGSSAVQRVLRAAA
ncbi:MAG: recombinase family protein [Gammaproteobacteria bacterium]